VLSLVLTSSFVSADRREGRGEGRRDSALQGEPGAEGGCVYRAEEGDAQGCEGLTGRAAGALYVFPVAVLLAVLILPAQYASWSLPLAVLPVAPLAVASAPAGVLATGGGQQCLHPDRLAGAGGSGGEERCPRRRIRARAGDGGAGSARRGHRGGTAAPAPILMTFAGLLPAGAPHGAPAAVGAGCGGLTCRDGSGYAARTVMRALCHGWRSAPFPVTNRDPIGSGSASPGSIGVAIALRRLPEALRSARRARPLTQHTTRRHRASRWPSRPPSYPLPHHPVVDSSDFEGRTDHEVARRDVARACPAIAGNDGNGGNIR